MKKLVTSIGLLLLLAFGSVINTQGALITLNWAPGNYSGGNNGGEFQAITSGGNLGNFQTFCIQDTVYFNPGQTYNYTINTSEVTLGTAWIYDEYRKGVLPGYNYTWSTPGHTTSSTDAQEAIWYFQNTGPWGDIALLSPGALTYVHDANTAISGGWHNTDVVGLDLWDANHNPAQAQLGIAAVPETSTWVSAVLLLLPMGASTLRILRKHTVIS